MPIWFEGKAEINTTVEQIEPSLRDPGAHHVAVTGLMPGLTSVELVEQGPDFVTIKTNEGLMQRTNMAVVPGDGTVTLEFDEEYQAGAVSHELVISGVEARRLLGFFYRKFGSSNTGNAVLQPYKSHFDGQTS